MSQIHVSVSEDEEGWEESLERFGKVGLGCATGWLVSSVGMKIGKIAAFMGGCGLIVVLVANKKGYLKKKSDYIGRGVLDVKKNLQIELSNERSENAIMKFLKERDVYITGGFVAGLLLGISSS